MFSYIYIWSELQPSPQVDYSKENQGGTTTINKIRQQILYFIKEANPESILKAHEVRAIATSVNYFHFMDFQAFSEYTGWKSLRVFMKHYFENLKALCLHTVAAGKAVPPGRVALDNSDPNT